jgi:hypothetical protein
MTREKLTYRKLLRELDELWARDGKMLKKPNMPDILDDLASSGVEQASEFYFRYIAHKRGAYQRRA